MTVDTDPEESIGGDSRSYRYYRNAVERHWDPHDIDLSEDRVRIARLDDPGFEALRRTLALFGAGEEAVTADLAPLAAVLGNVNDQLFVASQTYEEAKHADFFHRYWETVIEDEEHARGNDISSPTDDRWFPAAYFELFDRTQEAMDRLLTEDSPENRAKAYCHYHMTVEGILAQTGYYGVQTTFSGEVAGTPELPGLVEGFSKVRSDEGRHVGFGMAQLKDLVQSGAVPASLLEETVGELVELTQEIVAEAPRDDEGDYGPGPSELTAYAAEKHTERMRQITADSEDLPDIEELVQVD
jgi:ribonucleoside-diphosphate reductase beta chain